MKTRVSLVVQDGVMIPQSEVVPLAVDAYNLEEMIRVVATTTRFLRCGCPAVQWLTTTDDSLSTSERKNAGPWVSLDQLMETFSNLQWKGEDFQVQAPSAKWGVGSVFVVTRTIEQKTVATTFDKLKLLEKFYPHHSSKSICQKVAVREHQNVYRQAAIYLEGEHAGQEIQVDMGQSVLKIVE